MERHLRRAGGIAMILISFGGIAVGVLRVIHGGETMAAMADFLVSGFVALQGASLLAEAS